MKCLVTIYVFVWLASAVKGQIKFDLSQYDPDNKTTHLVKQFINLTKGTSQISIENVSATVGFYIVQVHTLTHNLTLSETEDLKSQTFITGSNVGLFGRADKAFYVFAKASTKALAVVTIYATYDPVPGGCNLSFNTDMAPYQVVTNTDNLVVVQSQAPSAPDTTCELNNIKVEMYHMYLPENDYSEAAYYDGIQQLTTVDGIRANGFKVTTVDGYFKYRKLYSSYRGIGHVFAIVATFKNRSSAYVPAATYSCDLNDKAATCYGPVTPHWKLICAVLLIFGPFICFYGHRYFRLTLYLVGFATGVFTTYIVLSFSSELAITEKTTVSLVIGLLYASLWLFIWWKFGSPIVSITLTLFLASYIIAAALFYIGLADLVAFRSDVNYWITQFSLMVALFFLWGMFTLQGHIFACSFLGAYACITAVNYYAGGNLQYVIINSFRRITVEHFDMATIDPPFQILDNTLAVIWGILTALGFYRQWREQRGRPPFPSPRLEADGAVTDETRPLMPGRTYLYYL